MKQHAFYTLFLALLLWTTVSQGQRQNNQWRFGGTGLDFNGRPPLNTSGVAMRTPEGSASVADRQSGKLLFYTDGVTVWNSLNQPMPNGTGLSGGTATLLSSTTAAVIVPKPGSNSQYYIVTIDEGATSASSRGVCYNLLDMSLSGGLGDIVPGQKNIPLLATSSEKLEVVPHANGSDFWVITQDFGNFYAFQLSSSGFSSPAVRSIVGGNLGNTAGHLKVNRQFDRLVCGSLFEAQLRMFRFDNTSGVVSDLLSWKLAPAILQSSPLIYGVEFSPSGRFVYVSNLDVVVQYDLANLSASAIENSDYVLPKTSFSQPASLQLGPDKKIYLNAGGLEVIDCPDNSGDKCGYRKTTLIGGGYGLPKWVYLQGEKFDLVPNAIVAFDSCAGSDIRFSIKDSSGINSVSWNFGDPGSGARNSAFGNSVLHAFSQPGLFNIKAIVSGECTSDTLVLPSFRVLKCSSGSLQIDFSADSCLQRSVSFAVKGSIKVDSILSWNFGDAFSGSQNSSTLNTPQHVFSRPGTYVVTCIVRVDCSKSPSPGNPTVKPCFYLDTLRVQVKVVKCEEQQDCQFAIPNTFSPNDDGTNDLLEVFAGCSPESYEMSIYNRWGGLVFKSVNPSEQWNGRFQGVDCPPGVYVCVLNYRLNSGSEKSSCSSVTLIR